MGFICYVNGRTDPTQFFYNMIVVFDATPDLYSLKRAIEQQCSDDNVACDGSEFIVSDIEILDFRLNEWVNLDSRSQLYSGCFLTAIRDTMTSTCAGAVDTTHQTSLQRVLGFAVNSMRLFEALDVDGEGVLRLKGLLKVLRHDVEYAVEVFNTLDSDVEGVVTFQQFVSFSNEPERKQFLAELKERIEHGGKRIDVDEVPNRHKNLADVSSKENQFLAKDKTDATADGDEESQHSSYLDSGVLPAAASTKGRSSSGPKVNSLVKLKSTSSSPVLSDHEGIDEAVELVLHSLDHSREDLGSRKASSPIAIERDRSPHAQKGLASRQDSGKGSSRADSPGSFGAQRSSLEGLSVGGKQAFPAEPPIAPQPLRRSSGSLSSSRR